MAGGAGVILTPDQRVRVFVSSTMEELADERAAVRRAIERLRLSPVLFELGARAHPPRSLYSSYLEQSHILLCIYWQRYGWVAPGMTVSGLEDEYLLGGSKPKLVYVKRPAPDRDARLDELLERVRSADDVSYKSFSTPEELETLVADDLALMLSESFLVEPAAERQRRPRLTLPADPTTFVGREADLAEIHALFARDDVRVVTLTGPGGIGKTRLALRAAAEVAPSFEEGAAFVALASLQDPALVADAIAAAVGVRDVASESLRDALRTDLAVRSLLLVVDNIEHLLPAAADVVAELVASAPGVKALVTSREALRIRAEHELPVPPLGIADSVHLFETRASAVRHGFVVDDSNTKTIATICERLEHLPLAIELAAARARLLPPEALLERLDRTLDLLVSRARDLPERQRALRSTIQWSYDLLDEDERRLFAALGVFVGSFSLAAVEALAPSDGPEVLDLLASLVDKSLLRAEPAAGEPRFRMLEMIREFAAERLDQSGDAEAVRERHAAFFRCLSVELGRGVRGSSQLEWLQVLGRDGEGDADNVRAALAWYLARLDLDAFAEMAWELWVPAWINGRVEEGHRLAHAALDAEGAMSVRSRARLLVVAGMFDMWRGDHTRAVAAQTEALELGRTLGDDDIVAYATIAAAMSAGPLEGEARARELAHEAVELCRRAGDRWGEGVALNVVAWLVVGQGSFEGNGPLLEDALAASSESGDEHLVAMAEVNLAELRLHDGDGDGAARLLAASAQRYRSLRSLYSVAYLLDAAARLAFHVGDARRAAQLLGAADHLRANIGVPVWGSQLERRDSLLGRLRTALGAEYDSTCELGAELTYDEAVDLASPPA
jgi:predicted ATPase